MTLLERLKKGAIKAGIVGAVGAATSMVFLQGNEMVYVANSVVVPKFVAHGTTLFLSTYAADMAMPHIVPWMAGGVPQLKKFENLVLQPMVVGTIATLAESILVPAVVTSEGGTLFKALLVAGSSTVLGSYIAQGTGMIDNVVSF